MRSGSREGRRWAQARQFNATPARPPPIHDHGAPRPSPPPFEAQRPDASHGEAGEPGCRPSTRQMDAASPRRRKQRARRLAPDGGWNGSPGTLPENGSSITATSGPRPATLPGSRGRWPETGPTPAGNRGAGLSPQRLAPAAPGLSRAGGMQERPRWHQGQGRQGAPPQPQAGPSAPQGCPVSPGQRLPVPKLRLGTPRGQWPVAVPGTTRERLAGSRAPEELNVDFPSSGGTLLGPSRLSKPSKKLFELKFYGRGLEKSNLAVEIISEFSELPRCGVVLLKFPVEELDPASALRGHARRLRPIRHPRKWAAGIMDTARPPIHLRRLPHRYGLLQQACSPAASGQPRAERGRQDSAPPREPRGAGRSRDTRAAFPRPEARRTYAQRLDGSRDSAIHTKYRISLRSSSMREPRYPLPRVVHKEGAPDTEATRACSGTPFPWRGVRCSRVGRASLHARGREGGAPSPACHATGSQVVLFPGYDNDPSAGSPTETLLRLLLPLNDKV
ncbi:hypothetical protein SADUNF_Sadunf07G0063700 [Salix dunnii]|uniref:Uncharacterized protein n=1 Tax=Salix dunnii TaxID=1413687 RepID=A0A835MVA5_9ROSI|nr:hypothetical protein SADUNF_Sadunf07G0063700 [Salix dunnii]